MKLNTQNIEALSLQSSIALQVIANQEVVDFGLVQQVVAAELKTFDLLDLTARDIDRLVTVIVYATNLQVIGDKAWEVIEEVVNDLVESQNRLFNEAVEKAVKEIEAQRTASVDDFAGFGLEIELPEFSKQTIDNVTDFISCYYSALNARIKDVVNAKYEDLV